jgi:hypothetical protein
MQGNAKGTGWKIAAIALLSGVALMVAAQQVSSLIVSGQQGQAKVVQIQGANYVEVNGLARLTGGSISFSGNHLVLTLPGSGGDSQAAQAAAAPSAPAGGLSNDFLNAGIEAMSQVREWHAALKNAIEHSYPLGADWLGSFRAQARQALRLTEVAASTDGDKQALQLLTNEVNNMSKLSDKYLQLTANVSYIAPDSLSNDPLDQKLLSCAHSLASMASTRQFVDDGSCQ